MKKKNLTINEIESKIKKMGGIVMSNGFQLITNNTEHFKRSKDIEIANWTK
ncbi:MAG: hypothetical protein WC209_14630 [Ignavibacteriaceae bacterium]|jgi:predicted nucleic acid-binding protein